MPGGVRWLHGRWFLSVPTFGDLPLSENTDGDTYVVENPGGPGTKPAPYTWNENLPGPNKWEPLLSSGTPGLHGPTHELLGPDQISIAGLGGEAADPQKPKEHHADHEVGGPGEINVANLSGRLADPQNADTLQGRTLSAAAPALGDAIIWNPAAMQWEPGPAGGGAGFGLTMVDATAGPQTVTLPDATLVDGDLYSWMKSDATINPVTIQTVLGQTIQGRLTLDLMWQWSKLSLRARNGNWVIDIASWYPYPFEVYDDVFVNGTQVSMGGSVRPPSFALFRDNGAGSDGVWLPRFNRSSTAPFPGQTKEMFFGFQIPHRYARGKDCYIHLHWSPGPSGTTVVGNVYWKIEFTFAQVNGLYSNTTVLDLKQPAGGANWKHQITSDLLVSGVGMQESAVFVCRVYRDNGGADEWPSDDAFLLSVDLHFPVIKSGTRLRSPPWD